MNRIKKFNDYRINEQHSDMILEEWLLPTYQKTIKRKLSFLKTINLSDLEPASTNQMEIKELWRKIMKKMYNKEKAQKYITIVDNSVVHDLSNTLDIIKKIKKSISNDENIGHIIFSNDKNKFYYEKPIIVP